MSALVVARILLTAGVVQVTLILGRLPLLPPVEVRRSVVAPLMSDWLNVSEYGLGLVPIWAGYLAVELASLVLPPLWRFRRSGADGRERLMGWAPLVGAVFAVVHIKVLAVEVPHGPWGQLILLGWTLGLAGAAVLIDRCGIGHGLLVLSVFTWPGVLYEPERFAVVSTGESVGAAFFLVAVCIGVGGLHRWLQRSADTTQVPAPAGGLWPFYWAVSLFGLIAGDAQSSDLATSLPGLTLMTLLFVAPAAWLFNRPSLVARTLGLEIAEARRSLVSSLPRAVLMVVGAGLVPYFLFRDAADPAPNLPILLHPVVVAFIVALALDLFEEIRRRSEVAEPMVEVARIYESWAMPALKAALVSNALPTCFRGAYVRSLLQYLGPHVPVVVFAPRSQAERVRVTVGEVMGGATLRRPEAASVENRTS